MNQQIEIIKRLLHGVAVGDLEQLKDKYLKNTSTEFENLQILSAPIPRYSQWPSKQYAETMIGYHCLENIEQLLKDVIEHNIPGDFIETGVWAGGACIYAKKLLDFWGENRKVFVADSFNGLPKPEMERYPQDEGDPHHTYEPLKISCDEVKGNFKKYNCLDKNVIFLEGWFKDTLPTLKNNQKFSIIRLDGDMYCSTMDALENLYPKLSVGGWCIIDDYALPNCAAAVHDFRNKYNINETMNLIIGSEPPYGASSQYWKKENNIKDCI